MSKRNIFLASVSHWSGLVTYDLSTNSWYSNVHHVVQGKSCRETYLGELPFYCGTFGEIPLLQNHSKSSASIKTMKTLMYSTLGPKSEGHEKKEVCFDFSFVGKRAHSKWADPTPTIYGLLTIPFVCKPRKCSILAHLIWEFPNITSKHSGQIPLL